MKLALEQLQLPGIHQLHSGVQSKTNVMLGDDEYASGKTLLKK